MAVYHYRYHVSLRKCQLIVDEIFTQKEILNMAVKRTSPHSSYAGFLLMEVNDTLPGPRVTYY